MKNTIKQASQSNRVNLINSILEYCEDIITIQDPQMRYISCNKSFLKLLGEGNQSKIINKSIHDLFDKDSADELVSHFQDVFKSGKPKSYIVRTKNKTIDRIIKQNTTPIFSDGKIEYIISI